MSADELLVAEGDLALTRDLVEGIESAELFLYPGNRHLFADSSLAAYDVGAAQLPRRHRLVHRRERTLRKVKGKRHGSREAE